VLVVIKGCLTKPPDTLLKMAPRFSCAVVSLTHGLLLANLLQSSNRPFPYVSFPRFLAFQEGMLDRQVSALGGSPTVSPPLNETPLLAYPVCNYRSIKQLRGQSQKLVWKTKFHVFHE
jgi:hypothetical protein